ncbi:DUF1758 domain-containing protein [Nephila pilipes]|uniref:DUF1758 domain-containing protein n=1 Tax=Nephila pilipes TaxID=299642 RepID=A0A8X6TCI7_NEPPI|nr:DUF1758 domain-containing protein [Nephila pilipes]
MCPEPRKNNEPKSFVPKSENSLSNCSRSETVFLQTLGILIRCQGQEKIIRAVIDSGSQSSYVSEKIMTQLKAFPLRTETVVHALFGGANDQLYDQKVIKYLQSRKKIVFADFFREETDINLLIGADVLGKLLTGNTVVLECGLTAVETKLRWTVFGKGSCRIDNILPSLSMHSMSLPGNKLWELEVLGIASENEKEKDAFNLKDFNDKIKILSDSRYEEYVDGELGGEESNSNNVTDNENNVTSADDVIVRKFTSSGRPVKAPTRLDLLNNIPLQETKFFRLLCSKKCFLKRTTFYL